MPASPNTAASPTVNDVRMNAAERRATAGLASIYGLRLLGMFIILPVFAPAEARGAAIGVNSSMQFLGAFAGAAAGGWLSEHLGGASVFILGVAPTGVWLVATATMAAPRARFGTNYSMGET